MGLPHGSYFVVLIKFQFYSQYVRPDKVLDVEPTDGRSPLFVSPWAVVLTFIKSL